MRTLGIVLAVLGALALAFGSFTYVTGAGGTQMRKTVWIPPVVAGITLVSGLILIVLGSKRSPA